MIIGTMEVALASVSLVSGEECITYYRPGSPPASGMTPTHTAAQLVSERNTQPSEAAGAA